MSTKYVTTVHGKPSLKPTRKVMMAGIAGAIVAVVIFLVQTFVPDFPLTAEVAAAFELLVVTIVAYFTSPGEAEGVKEVLS